MFIEHFVEHKAHKCLDNAPVGKNILVEPEVVTVSGLRGGQYLVILLHRPSCPDVAAQRDTASDDW